MRAWRFHEFGPIENLQIDEVPMPSRSPGEVLLQVRCASLNPADRYMVAGQYPRPAPLPFAVGRDCAATVCEADDDSGFLPGDNVVLLCSDLGVSRTGTLAEYVTAPATCLAPLPPNWTAAEGAAAPLVYLTAWQALVDRGALEAGQTVLITGASGGVGSAAIMLAKGMGARVIAMTRGNEKVAALHALGADLVLDSALEGLLERTRTFLADERIDLVVDNLGGDYLSAAVELVGYGGRVVVVGLLAGFEAPIRIGVLIHKCIQIQGMSVNAYDPPAARAAWSKIVALLESKGCRPLIHRVFDFEMVPEGFATLQEGPLGKVCILVGLSEHGDKSTAS